MAKEKYEEQEQVIDAVEQEANEPSTVDQQASEEEQVEDAPEEIDQQQSVDELKQRIESLESEQADLKNRLLRVQADYDNYRRRTKEDKAATAKYKSQSLAEKLLPVIDNFERALHVQVEDDESGSVLQGMEIVYRQLKDAFEQENIKEIEAEGQPFDPQLHQAVAQVESEEAESNTVVDVMQKGYMLNDRVIRPAMVKVTS